MRGNKYSISRLKRLLAMLKENRYPNYPRFLAEMKRMDIAGAYSLSARTLQRDIAFLKSEYRAPIDDKRIGTVIFGKSTSLRDRNEEEVRGYRNALDLIHNQAKKLPLTVETICRLHALIRPDTWDAGKFKEEAGDIIETYADGSSRIRFKTVAPDQVEAALTTVRP